MIDARGLGHPANLLATRKTSHVAIWAADYVGLPWRAYGRDRAGVDCWGLVVLVYREQFGIALPAFSTLSWPCSHDSPAAEVQEARQRIAGVMSEVANRSWRVVDRTAAQRGDVLLLRLAGVACHVGLVVGERHMLHAEEGVDVVLDDFTGLKWSRRIEGVFRLDHD